MKTITHIKNAYIAISAAMIVLGVVFVIFPKLSFDISCYIMGGLIAAFGIAKLISYFSKDLYRLAFQFDFALGIAAIAIGILIMLNPELIALILGIFLVFDGTFKLQTSIDSKRFGMTSWGTILALAIITCICGLFLIFAPIKAAKVLSVIMGISLIADGIQNLCITAYTVKAARSKDEVFVTVEEDDD